VVDLLGGFVISKLKDGIEEIVKGYREFYWGGDKFEIKLADPLICSKRRLPPFLSRNKINSGRNDYENSDFKN